MDIEGIKQLFDVLKIQGEEYQKALDEAGAEYATALELIKEQFQEYLEAKEAWGSALGVPASPAKVSGSPKGKMPCLLCGADAHHASYAPYKSGDGKAGVKVDQPGACNGKTVYLLVDGDKGVYPLSSGQISGIRKSHGVNVTFTKG